MGFIEHAWERALQNSDLPTNFNWPWKYNILLLGILSTQNNVTDSIYRPLAVPMAPDNFTATTIGPRNISFTWDNDSIDHMYRLSCGTADTPTVLTRNVTGASSVEYHVFHPNTLYTCNLSVISNGTVGPNTTVEVQTAEDSEYLPCRPFA